MNCIYGGDFLLTYSVSSSLKVHAEAVVLDLQAKGQIDLLECFIDGIFAVAKKGGHKVGKASAA